MRLPACVISGTMLMLLAGCEDLQQLNEPTTRAPLSPPGVLPIGASTDPTSVPAAAPPAATGEPTAPAPIAAAPASGSIINKTTAKVVDAAEAKQNPDIIEVENKVSGSDPVTVATSAYVTLRAKPQILAFKANMKLIIEGEGRVPTYDEFQQMMKTNRIDFVELYPYQMYGYDATTGNIVVLENKAEKARIYQEAGLNPDGT